MDEWHREFFEDLARFLDFWVDATAAPIADPEWTPEADRGWPQEVVWAFRTLRQVLTTPEHQSALRAVLFAGLSGLLHSALVTLDGGSALAEKFTLTLTTSDGHTLGPGLDEFWVGHLYDTGRLPYPAGPDA